MFLFRHVHGGAIATIFDEVLGTLAYYVAALSVISMSLTKSKFFQAGERIDNA